MEETVYRLRFVFTKTVRDLFFSLDTFEFQCVIVLGSTMTFEPFFAPLVL